MLSLKLEAKLLGLDELVLISELLSTGGPQLETEADIRK